jgi:SSS family transporter
MQWMTQHWLAAVLLLTYSLLLLYNAYVGSKMSGGLEDFYVGGRKMGGLAIGISFFATFASTNSYIGHAGKGYSYGLAWMTMPLMLILFTYVSWRWIGPKTRRLAARFDALTLPDFLASRFLGADAAGRRDQQHPLLIFSGLVIVFCSILYLVAIFKGVGHLFESFFNVPYEVAIGIALVIVMLYTSVGGFVSVVRTDVIQGGLMMIGAVTIFYFVTSAAGGVTALADLRRMPTKDFLFDINGGISFVVLLGVALSGSLKLIVDPRQSSRFYALKDEASLRQGMWAAVIGLTVVQLCLYPVGIYAHLLMTGVTDTDLIIPTLVNDPSIFPVWAGDFLLVAIIAAAMSSMDSVLLVASATLFKNLIQPLNFPASSSNPLAWTRTIVLFLAMISAGFALDPPGDILAITIFSGSLYAACFLPAVVCGLYWAKGSAAGVLASMAVGIIMLFVWITSGMSSFLHEVFPALAISLLVYWLVGLLSDHSVDLEQMVGAQSASTASG